MPTQAPAPTRSAGTARTARTMPRPTALQWRVLRDGGASGARNMALDHALASCLSRGTGVVRLYAWARPTVSFGRNEPARGLYSVRAAQERGIDWVRRPTGGRAVLHADEITYAVVTPVRALGGARAAYRSINEALATALRTRGADVEVVEEGATSSPDAGPCFQSPAPGEVVAGGRKLIGSAQARIGRALLQHGSILLAGDQSALGELACRPHDTGPTPATLQEQMGAVDQQGIGDAIVRALARAFGGRWSEGGYARGERAEADRLEGERYGRESWTWRR